MGWHNGPPSWAEMERVLSGRPRRDGARPGESFPPPYDQHADGHTDDEGVPDGGDSPAWSRKREAYLADETVRPIRSTTSAGEQFSPGLLMPPTWIANGVVRPALSHCSAR